MLDVLCIGHASLDVAMAVGVHPEDNEKMLASAMRLSGGGPAANAAVAVARLGGRSGFCGYLGDDAFGALHFREFAREGVDTSLVVRGRHPTPVSQILAKPDGARSVVNFRADTPHLPAGVIRISRLPKVILFDGHEPLISTELMQRIRGKRVTTMLDAGSMHHGTRDLAAKVDVLAVSEDCARDWHGMNDMNLALEHLASFAPTVIITLGARGLIWSRHGETGNMLACDVSAVDTTGAGDAFHGALALGLARGMEWSQLLYFASAVAALTCTRLGARASLPGMDAVRQLMDRGKDSR